MVGHRNGEMEWEDNSSPRTSYGNRVGRIEARLGSVLPRNQYWGTLFSPGEEPTHQLPGAPGSYSSAADLCKERERGLSPTENRQHGSSCLYQQSRGNSVKGTSLPHQKTLDVVPGEEYSHTVTAPPWCHESNSRCRIESNEGSVRLEIGSTGIPEDQQCLRTTGSGSLCIPTDQSVPPLLQLAARSISRGHGCILPELGGNEGVCQPSLDLISCVLAKTQTQGADLTLVAPVWKAQPWYAVLLSMLVDWPCLLSAQSVPTSASIPIQPKLAVWSISGRDSMVKAFQAKLQNLSFSHGGQKPTSHMTPFLGNGVTGVVNGVQIHFQDL